MEAPSETAVIRPPPYTAADEANTKERTPDLIAASSTDSVPPTLIEAYPKGSSKEAGDETSAAQWITDSIPYSRIARSTAEPSRTSALDSPEASMSSTTGSWPLSSRAAHTAVPT